MLIMKYLGLKTEYEVNFGRISENIVQLLGNFPAKEKGFTLSRKEKEDAWDYSNYSTVYREIDGGVQFSNDGSVYVAPPEPEPEPEPQPEPQPTPKPEPKPTIGYHTPAPMVEQKVEEKQVSDVVKVKEVLPNTGTESATALTSLGLLGVIATGLGLARKKKED